MVILGKLQQQIAYAWERSPFYRRKWSEAGVSPDTLKRVDDDSRSSRSCRRLSYGRLEAAAPFGDYLCVGPEEVARIHGTSGTTGRPTVFGVGREDWERIGEAHARILWRPGCGPTTAS